MWYELTNRLIKSPLVARFMVMLFFLSWSEQTWQTCYCQTLLQYTKVEDPNAVYLMKSNPQTESKNRQRSYTGDQYKQ